MAVITITNTKGGTGKTSTAFHLASCYAHAGKRVLIIDADPQASITSGFWGQDALVDIDPRETIHELFVGNPLPTDIIQESPVAGVDVVPGHEEMETWMLPFKHQESWWEKLSGSIKKLTDVVAKDYHHVLIDTPPNLALLTHASLTASSFAMIPVQPEDFGARGVERVNKAIARVQDKRGGWPWMLGYIVMMSQKAKATHGIYQKRMREEFGEQVFDTVVPDAHDFVKSLISFKPLSKINKKGTAFTTMSKLKDEIDSRIEAFRERRVA